ncbi:nischarin-like isoform X2 [Haemaphysalis longicornis]
MALYRPVQSWMNASEAVKIIGTEQGDGFTVYRIQVRVTPYCWVAKHRYSDFKELHAKEVRTVVSDLAERLFETGEQILATDSRFTVSPLELHCLTERLKLAEPTCSSEDKRRDLGHVLDFVSQLRHLRVEAPEGCLEDSNVRPSCLPFDLAPFRSLHSLALHGCEVRGQLSGLETVRPQLSELSVEHCCSALADLSCVLLAGDLWQAAAWPQVKAARFSHTGLRRIDLSVRLLGSVERLSLAANEVSEVEQLECLSHLSELDLSDNRLRHLLALHTRLGNVRCLRLAGNRIHSLAGLSRMYSLVELDVSRNSIALVSEVGHVGALPCLESLDLRQNPVGQLIDYRPHALLLFGQRASEVVLDGQKATQKELDTVNVLRALRVAKEGSSQPTWGAAPSAAQPPGQAVRTGGSGELMGVRRPLQPPQQPTEAPAPDEFREQVSALRALGGTDWLRLLNRMHQDRLHEQPTTQPPEASKPLRCNEVHNEDDEGEAKAHLEPALPDWLLRTGLHHPSFRDELQAQARGYPPEWCAWCAFATPDATGVACVVANRAGLSLLEPEGELQSGGAVHFGRTTTFPASQILQLLSGPQRSYLELRTESGSTLLLPASSEDTDSLARRFATTFDLQARDKFSSGKVVESAATSSEVVRFCGRVLLSSATPGIVHYVVVACREIVLLAENAFGAAPQPFEVKRSWSTAPPVVDVSLPEKWPSVVASAGEFGQCGFGVAVEFEGGARFEARFQTRDSRSQFLEAFLATRNS